MLAPSPLSGILLCILVPAPGEAPMRRLSVFSLILVPILGLAAALGLSGCGGDKTSSLKRIIVITNGYSPFWDAGRAGLMDAKQQLELEKAGYDADLIANDGTDQGQLDKLRQYGSQTDVVAIGVSVNTAGNKAITDEMRNLQKRGIKVVTIDSDVDRDTDRDARFAFLGTDNFVGGEELGKCAKGLRPEGGEYVTFVGHAGTRGA